MGIVMIGAVFTGSAFQDAVIVRVESRRLARLASEHVDRPVPDDAEAPGSGAAAVGVVALTAFPD